VREVADGAQPQPQQHLLGLGADTPQRADRQRVQEVDDLGRADDEQPSGLARVEASLATNLVPATPTEQVMPCSS
jgi:hypothetical protein